MTVRERLRGMHCCSDECRLAIVMSSGFIDWESELDAWVVPMMKISGP